MRIRARWLAVGILGAVVLLLGTVLVVGWIDRSIADARVAYWRGLVQHDLPPGSTRSDVDKWLSAHGATWASLPGQPRILFDKNGNIHRPADYSIELESIQHIWPDGYSVCVRPVVVLHVHFNAADEAEAIDVDSSMTCL